MVTLHPEKPVQARKADAVPVRELPYRQTHGCPPPLRGRHVTVKKLVFVCTENEFRPVPPPGCVCGPTLSISEYMRTLSVESFSDSTTPEN
jgi:hypothetical protein